MGRVSTEDIIFLEDYLRKKGVLFVDVRQEIIDHVCCSVQDKEGDFKELSIAYLKEYPDLIKNNKGYVFIMNRLLVDNKTQVYKLWSKENVMMFLGITSIVFILFRTLSRFMETQEVFDLGFTTASVCVNGVFLTVLFFTFFKKRAFSEPWKYVAKMTILMNVLLWSSLIVSKNSMGNFSFILLAAFLAYTILMFKVFIDVLRVMNRKYLV